MKAKTIKLSSIKKSSRRERVLRLLCDGNAHSGEMLAKQLRISRSAIWKIIGSLRKLGIEISASRSQGYQLAQSVELYDSNSISLHLAPSIQAQLTQADAFLSLDSTNRLLCDTPHAEHNTAQLCVTEIQHSGRGRRGRAWLSPFGSGICMSLAWRFEESPSSLSSLSLVVGVAVLRALRRFDAQDIKLKWPNDLTHNNRKLGGILIEMRGESAGPARVVIGLGLNFHLPPQFKLDLATQHSALIADLYEALADRLPSRNELVAVLTEEIMQALIQFSINGFDDFVDEWHTHDALKDAPVRVLCANETVLGIARGSDIDGALLVESQGQVRRFLSGDVSLRPQ